MWMYLRGEKKRRGREGDVCCENVGKGERKQKGREVVRLRRTEESDEKNKSRIRRLHKLLVLRRAERRNRKRGRDDGGGGKGEGKLLRY